MNTFESKNITITIKRAYNEVCEYLMNPASFAEWASGLGKMMRSETGEWEAMTPFGAVKIRFAEKNAYGVVDHRIIPERGEEIYVPMRVIPNGEGVDILFTLFRLPFMTTDKYLEDIGWVEKDLAKLKEILERRY